MVCLWSDHCKYVLHLSHWQVKGQIGDTFGAINALFSRLAFAGLIITILLQREELKAQNEELQNNTQALKDQKDEMKNQREEMALQVAAMNKQWQAIEDQNTNINRQRLETTLLNMWNLHFQVRDQVNVRDSLGINGMIYLSSGVMSQAIALARNRTEVTIRTSVIGEAAARYNNQTSFVLCTNICQA